MYDTCIYVYYVADVQTVCVDLAELGGGTSSTSTEGVITGGGIFSSSFGRPRDLCSCLPCANEASISHPTMQEVLQEEGHSLVVITSQGELVVLSARSLDILQEPIENAVLGYFEVKGEPRLTGVIAWSQSSAMSKGHFGDVVSGTTMVGNGESEEHNGTNKSTTSKNNKNQKRKSAELESSDEDDIEEIDETAELSEDENKKGRYDSDSDDDQSSNKKKSGKFGQKNKKNKQISKDATTSDQKGKSGKGGEDRGNNVSPKKAVKFSDNNSKHNSSSKQQKGSSQQFSAVNNKKRQKNRK